MELNKVRDLNILRACITCAALAPYWETLGSCFYYVGYEAISYTRVFSIIIFLLSGQASTLVCLY